MEPWEIAVKEIIETARREYLGGTTPEVLAEAVVESANGDSEVRIDFETPRLGAFAYIILSIASFMTDDDELRFRKALLPLV